MRKSWMKNCFLKWNADGTMLQSTATDQRRADTFSASLDELRNAIIKRSEFSGNEKDLETYLTFHGFGQVRFIKKPTQASDCLLALAWCQAWKKPMSAYLAI